MPNVAYCILLFTIEETTLALIHNVPLVMEPNQRSGRAILVFSLSLLFPRESPGGFCISPALLSVKFSIFLELGNWVGFRRGA